MLLFKEVSQRLGIRPNYAGQLYTLAVRKLQTLAARTHHQICTHQYHVNRPTNEREEVMRRLSAEREQRNAVNRETHH